MSIILCEQALERIELEAERGKLINELNALDKEQYEADKALMESQSQYSEAYRKYLEALKGKLTSKSKDKAISNELQNQIDYYKTIIDAVKAVEDKYVAEIDNELDALKESKDALKENNDELQREIDLKEALVNLENAKKRKVWVYSEGTGFKQVQNEKAVKEAAEKYRNSITDTQEAEIDKQIKEKEREKERIEKRNEDLKNAEDNINNAKTIAQAMKSLGLSNESELLTLPEKTKENIVESLADAIVKKDNEENKDKVDVDGKSLYVPVSLDDVLRNFGVDPESSDVKSVLSEMPTLAEYKAASGFAASLKEFTDKAVSGVVNNNGGMVLSPTFNIYDASDPDKIAKVVNKEITNLFTKVGNSIK